MRKEKKTEEEEEEDEERSMSSLQRNSEVDGWVPPTIRVETAKYGRGDNKQGGVWERLES